MSRFLNARYQAMTAYTPGEQPRVQKLIKLNTNESPYPPSPLAVQAVTADALERLRLYNDPDATELTHALAARYGVLPSQVVTGNGSDEILSFIFLAYGDAGILTSDITYGFYRVWARLYGIDIQEVPLQADFTIDPDDYLTGSRMVVLANPNAPTGLTLPRSAIARIAAANRDRIVVVDEAYVDFGGESAAPLIAQYDNLLVVQTFSKSRQLAGARLGFALGQPALIEDLHKMRYSINPYNVNSVTQLIGAASVRDEPYFRGCVEKILAARAYTADALRALNFRVLDSAANFLFAAPPDDDGARYLGELRARGILIRHFPGPRTGAFARISIGTIDDMRALIGATREVYA